MKHGDMDLLRHVLHSAKQQTYANDDAVPEILPDGGKRLRHPEGEFEYEDTYWGFEFFRGVELVRHKGATIWSMSYEGGMVWLDTRLTDEARRAEAKDCYAGLRKALRHPPIELPIRGIECLNIHTGERGDSNYEHKFIYGFNCEGNLESFKGEEIMNLAKGSTQNIYRLHCRGGLIR
jgi:hypothetical protein